jgi:hypothetical protein
MFSKVWKSKDLKPKKSHELPIVKKQKPKAGAVARHRGVLENNSASATNSRGGADNVSN